MSDTQRERNRNRDRERIRERNRETQRESENRKRIRESEMVRQWKASPEQGDSVRLKLEYQAVQSRASSEASCAASIEQLECIVLVVFKNSISTSA